MKKNKKGFTLIELLSVIIILGIILAIAVPRILDVINKSREESLESSAKLLIRTIEQEYEIRVMQGEEVLLTGNCTEYNWDPTNGSCTYSINEGIVTVTITGAGKFEGLMAEGTKESITIVAGEGSGTELPETEEITYVYDLDTVGENANPCLIDGLEFTHIEDKRDSENHKIYAVTKIGTQCWFAENLAYTTPECLAPTWNSSSPFNACREHSTSWGTEVLYQWGAVMNGSTTEGAQGLCPIGWTIPTDDEWKELEIELGMTEVAANNIGYRGTDQGQQLKSTNPSWGGTTNPVGFDALPAGFRGTSGTLNVVGSLGFWWSSSPSGSNAWRRRLYSSGSDVVRSTDSQADGHSVRCLLDN